MQEIKMNVAFTGHRTEKLTPNTEKLKRQLEIVIISAINDNFTTFYTGMSYGFDLIASEIVLEMKKQYPLELIAAVPYRNQAKNYSDTDKKEYHRILAECDEVIMCSEKFQRGAYHRRNRYMVDNSSLLIAYSDGSGGSQSTVNYAQKKGIQVINLFK